MHVVVLARPEPCRLGLRPGRTQPTARVPDPASPPARQALDHLDLAPAQRQLLMSPQREVQVTLSLLRDSGEVASFPAYRVQHDNSRGPYKGGLRFHPHVDLDDVRR